MKPRPQPGYYPGFDLLTQVSFWDEATRKTVLKRLDPPPPLRFFTPPEAQLLDAVCARILPQDDREPDRRIAIVPVIDERLAEGRINGYRFADMPPDADAHRLGLEAIQAISRHLHRRGFEHLTGLEKDAVLLTIHDGAPPAGEHVWHQMSVIRYWKFLLDDVVTAYYQHPWAWNEIGFGGPAYPRGYMRLERGEPEPWEVREQRHVWSPPADSFSGEFTPLAEAGPCWKKKKLLVASS
ncbi:MAG: gluconate 2-dehydrogenase subunit 3 family protein [Terriglobales bacterium]